MVDISLDDAKPMFLAYKEKADAANKIHASYVLATSGKDEAVSSFLTTSDDETVAKFRAYAEETERKIAEAKAALDENREKIRAYALTKVNVESDINPDQAQKDFLAARKDAHAAARALTMFLGEETYNAGVEKFGITEVQSLKRGGKTTGATGVKRPRIESATVNGVALDKATFTEIAKATNVSLDDFRTAAFQAAGTEDIMSLAEGTEVSLTVTDKDAKSYAVTFVPKARGTESDDSDDSDTESE